MICKNQNFGILKTKYLSLLPIKEKIIIGYFSYFLREYFNIEKDALNLERYYCEYKKIDFNNETNRKKKNIKHNLGNKTSFKTYKIAMSYFLFNYLKYPEKIIRSILHIRNDHKTFNDYISVLMMPEKEKQINRNVSYFFLYDNIIKEIDKNFGKEIEKNIKEINKKY